MTTAWPMIAYSEWHDTCSALHLYIQVAGKYRLANTPWQNHSWHATLYVNARGLTTSLIPDAGGIEIQFDLIEHRVRAANVDGRTAEFDLGPGTVAQFLARFSEMIVAVGGTPRINGVPNEVPDPVPFAQDHRPRPYDRDAVTRYFRALVAADSVFKIFRTGFLGKSSPVHLFWGRTRSSGNAIFGTCGAASSWKYARPSRRHRS